MAQIWVLNNVIWFGSNGTPVFRDIFARLQWYVTAPHFVRRVAHFGRNTLKLPFYGMWRRVYRYRSIKSHESHIWHSLFNLLSMCRYVTMKLICNLRHCKPSCTRQALYISHNIEARSGNHCCRPKAIHIRVACREGGSNPPPKFRSFDKVEPDCKLSGKCLVFLFQHPNLSIAEFRTPTPQDVRKKGSKILKLPGSQFAMTNKLVVVINSLKVTKTENILLYEMIFLVSNYSCLQNPWLGGYRLQIPIHSVLCPPLNLLNPPNKIPG